MSKNKFPPFERLTFPIHALQQMFQRRIAETEIRELIVRGVKIEDYPMILPIPVVLFQASQMIDRPMLFWHTIKEIVKQLLSQHTNPIQKCGPIRSPGENHEMRNL